MVTLTCQCCRTTREFGNLEAAFHVGWDAPPHFSTHICCNLCPAVCVVLGKSHAKAHAIWAKEGRPEEFTVEKCGTDEAIDDPAEANRGIDALRAFFTRKKD